jgi:hypothetical protein
VNFRHSLSAFKGIVPHLSLGVQVHTLGGDRYKRDVGSSDDVAEWSAYGAAFYARGTTSRMGETSRSYFNAFGQLGFGATLGVMDLTTGSDNGQTDRTRDTYVGYVIGAHAGLAFFLRAFGSPTSTSGWGWFGLHLAAGYDYAPTITNLTGETLNNGGPSLQLAARALAF